MAQTPDRIDPPEPAPAKPPARVRLFLPFILLLVLVALWSAGWFWIRDRAGREIDGWLAREAATGRTWTCADRSITGYPFRIELRCASLRLARSDGGFTLGPLVALVQVYQPRHGLLQAKGPFHVEQGDLVGDVSWTSLEGSFHGASNGFVRASLVVGGLQAAVRGFEAQPIELSAKSLELHARPTPGRFASNGAVDVSLRLAQAVVPKLDPLIGNADPSDVALDATVSQAAVLRTGPVAGELEKWRRADGSLDIALLSLAKGTRRLQAQGSLGLDDRHRPSGQLDLRAAGLEGLIGQIMGQRFGEERGALIGNLVGQFLGGLQRRDAADAPPPKAPSAEGPGASSNPRGDGRLTPLPPLRFADGRVLLGPIPIPNFRLPPLY